MYFDPLAAQAFRHLLGQWKAQVRAVDLRQSDQLSFHHRQQPGANGFHFWQFRHSSPEQRAHAALCTGPRLL